MRTKTEIQGQIKVCEDTITTLDQMFKKWTQEKQEELALECQFVIKSMRLKIETLQWCMETTPKTDDSKMLGLDFLITLEDGSKKVMTCVKWTPDTRAFSCDEGVVEMDWMEFIDQASLGRIKSISQDDSKTEGGGCPE